MSPKSSLSASPSSEGGSEILGDRSPIWGVRNHGTKEVGSNHQLDWHRDGDEDGDGGDGGGSDDDDDVGDGGGDGDDSDDGGNGGDSLRFPKAFLTLSLKSFHWRHNFSAIAGRRQS